MSIRNIFRQRKLESPAGMIESLVSKAIDYGKTSLELVKLKTLSKTSDVVSSLFAHTIVLFFAVFFLFFFTLGLAIWLGDYLGESSYGFFMVAILYGTAGILIRLLFHKRLKRMAADNIINQVLK